VGKRLQSKAWTEIAEVLKGQAAELEDLAKF
jgi:hypothetical protein